MLEIIKISEKQAKYSLFIPFTRDWLVDEFLEHLDKLLMPLGSMEFIFYNDTDNMSLQGKLRTYLENKPVNNASLYMSKEREPTEVSTDIRRQRIVKMRNKSRELISDSDYTICIEDDTFIRDERAIYKLINHIDAQENIGFVGGVQRGRWGYSIIGAWKVNNVKHPSEVSTLPYRQSGLQAVDGAGMYFYITPTNLYKFAHYHFEGECLGPDVCYVLDLRRNLFDCYVDWSIVCEHKTSNAILVPNEDCVSVTWNKIEDEWKVTNVAKYQTVEKRLT